MQGGGGSIEDINLSSGPLGVMSAVRYRVYTYIYDISRVPDFFDASV